MRKRFLRRLAILAAASVATLGAIVAVGLGPASADSEACTRKQSTGSISLPNKPDVTIDVTVCISYARTASGYINNYFATLRVEWRGGPAIGKRFDGFRVETRVERNDGVKKKVTCDYTSLINRDRSHSITCNAGVRYQKGKGWTADGAIFYDPDADGKGGTVKKLRGSPSLP